MKIYLFAESPELETIADEIVAAIAEWMPKEVPNLRLVNEPGDDEEAGPDAERKVGITLETKNKKALAKPLPFLYDLAKTHQCEFVVGIFDEHSGAAEDVCYFGYEEGRPDVDEIANYLGL